MQKGSKHTKESRKRIVESLTKRAKKLTKAQRRQMIEPAISARWPKNK